MNETVDDQDKFDLQLYLHPLFRTSSNVIFMLTTSILNVRFVNGLGPGPDRLDVVVTGGSLVIHINKSRRIR